jgi:hypothetical protein
MAKFPNIPRNTVGIFIRHLATLELSPCSANYHCFFFVSSCWMLCFVVLSLCSFHIVIEPHHRWRQKGAQCKLTYISTWQTRQLYKYSVSTKSLRHVASSICLRSTIFQNPEGILWTHCTFPWQQFRSNLIPLPAINSFWPVNVFTIWCSSGFGKLF